jgi:organic hydroperoxide reductase OsmC/OhrA
MVPRVATVRARVFEYAVSLDSEWTATSDRGGDSLPHDGDAWTPEHLVLAGLARCTLTALRHHADRAGIALGCEADAHGSVTRRDSDGRFAFVEIAFESRITIESPPDADELRTLLTSAERDCFVGASLTVSPTYQWVVNGSPLP